jgi:magnesium chelatase subunit I
MYAQKIATSVDIDYAFKSKKFLCLRHRLRKDPLESIDSGDKVGKVFKEIFEIEE